MKKSYLLRFRILVFYKVAKYLSFTKAAKQLFISQPAVTRHVKELESELELRLLERRGNDIVLTKAGEVVFQYIERASTLEEELQLSLAGLKEKVEGNLKVGVSTTIAQYILPEVLSSFYNQYPQVKVQITTANTTQIEDLIVSGKVQFGIVEGNQHSKDIKYEPMMDDEIVVAGNPSCEMVKKDMMTLEDLKKVPVVLRESGSGTLEVVENALKRDLNIKINELNVVMHLDSTEAIKSFVKSTKCLGFFSIHSINEDLMTGRLKVVDLDHVDMSRKLHIIYQQGPEPTGIIQQFIRYIKHYINTHY